jgi:hypothetical protein
MEGMLTRENIKLPRKEWITAVRTSLACFQGNKAILQIGNVLFDQLCALCSFTHVRAESIDILGVLFQCKTNFVLKVIDDNKVWEEGKDILDLEKRSVLDESHSSGYPVREKTKG